MTWTRPTRGGTLTGPDRPSIEERLATAGLPPLPRTAWLEVDLGAIADNLRAIRAVAGDGVRVEPVVKADAYGHGALPVAAALVAAGADGLCVATIDEAVELRDAGIPGPVLVLYPVPERHARLAAELDVAVTVGDATLLERLEDAVRGWPTGRELAVHVELETGLGRGGVLPDDLVAIARRVDAAPGLRLVGAWSHLADPGSSDRTAAQERTFAAGAGGLASGGLGPVVRHLAASGALVTGGVAPLDAVRPGLVVYGLAPDDLEAAGSALARALRPALALHARPVRVTDLPPGHGVSYGPSFVTARPSRIATLPVGYGDGWARWRSDRSEAIVRGVRVPLVGRVAMDAVMADVTDVPGPPVGVDDEFVLIGAQGRERITAADVARIGTTISWEVVTAMSARLPRVYHSAGVTTGLRTLAGRRAEWHASNSGTATSASSRSTRS